MSEISYDAWPDYLPGPRDDLTAIGVICLSYGHLEGLFQLLFAEITAFNRAQVEALFQRIANNNRTAVMMELLVRAEIPKNLEELVSRFTEGFGICVDNRNGLMHSSSGGMLQDFKTGRHGFVFTKYAKTGKLMACVPTLPELRAVADSMQAYAIFAANLTLAINSARETRMAKDSTWLPPSLDKPELPAKLHWFPHSDFLESLRQSGPSQPSRG